MESISEVGLLQPLIIDSRNQVISGNRRFESVKRLGWKEVEVNLIEVQDGEEELLLIHFNKQRIKSFKELINEYLILDRYYRKGQGRRTDLTSAKLGKGSSRETISKEIGISSGQLQKLVYINKYQPDHIELLDKGIAIINLPNDYHILNKIRFLLDKKLQLDPFSNHGHLHIFPIKLGESFLKKQGFKILKKQILEPPQKPKFIPRFIKEFLAELSPSNFSRGIIYYCRKKSS